MDEAKLDTDGHGSDVQCHPPRQRAHGGREVDLVSDGHGAVDPLIALSFNGIRLIPVSVHRPSDMRVGRSRTMIRTLRHSRHLQFELPHSRDSNYPRCARSFKLGWVGPGARPSGTVMRGDVHGSRVRVISTASASPLPLAPPDGRPNAVVGGLQWIRVGQRHLSWGPPALPDLTDFRTASESV